MTPVTKITFEGQCKTITEWALDYGITPGIIIARLERSDTIADAITTPMKVGHPGQQLPAFHRQQRRAIARAPHVWPPAPNPECVEPARRAYLSNPVTFNGETRALTEWAELTGIACSTLRFRKRSGWTVERMLTTPVRHAAGRGVVSNLPASVGTGGGSTAQERAQIDFHEKAITE